MSIRTRFAPSPTGYLHVGSARTALYCWLYARKMGGQFILRIEDTDQERSTGEAIHAILDAMKWLGLTWDTGQEPYRQMEHLERYNGVATELLDKGLAYRCTCSKERLEALRKQQLDNKEKPRYDGHCRDKNIPATSKDPFVVRFRNPDEGYVEFEDCVHGQMRIQNSELDDLVLLRSDRLPNGFAVPTYNFGVVVDDWDMEITHVIRGDDHLGNTPRQINILKALGAPIPIYAHIPMILGSDGKRLSKRHGAVSVQHYREEGILPQALLNYLVRLGWSHGDQEIFSMEEMIELFDLKDINKAAAAFNTEKLLWLNQHYIKTTQPILQVPMFKEELKKILDPEVLEAKNVPAFEKVIEAQQERAQTLKEMAEKSVYFYSDKIKIDKEAKEKQLTEEAKSYLKTLCDYFETISEQNWDRVAIHEAIGKTTETLSIKLGKLAQPLRVAVTGNTMSPPIDITLELIGKVRVIERIKEAIKS